MKGKFIMYIKPEELEDGRVLLYLKGQFMEENSQENLLALLSCIRDSQLIIPMKLTARKADKEITIKTKDGGTEKTDKKIIMKPDILKQGGKSYLPVFSNYIQLPADYAKDFTVVNMTFPGCVDLAHEYENLSGIVLDAFTIPFIIDFNLSDIILKIDSRLAPEKR